MTRAQVFCLTTILTGVIAVCFIAAIVHTWLRGKPYDPQFGIVLDAGSTHTSVHLFTWNEDDRRYGTARKVTEIGDHCESPKGVSEYTNAPEAAASLRHCMDDLAQTIPAKFQPKTTLHFGATAGMRILRESNPELTAKIMLSIKDVLATYPYDLRTLKILPGSEEGAAAWTSVNYLTNAFPIKKDENTSIKRFGSLDTGGASSQITFESSDAGDYQTTLDLYGLEYDVYSQSFLCYGTTQAEKMLLGVLAMSANYTTDVIENPCFTNDYENQLNGSDIFKTPCFNTWWTKEDWEHMYPTVEAQEFSFRGTGKADECQDLVQTLFPTGNCTASRCSFNGTDLPDYGETKFIASSGSYYFTAKRLNFLNQNISLKTFKSRIDNYCKIPIAQIKKLYPQSDWYYAVRSCYTAMYMYTLVTDAYKFNDDTWNNIQITKKINGTSIGWSLGLLLNETAALPPIDPVRPSVYLGAWVIMIVLAVVFTIATLLLLYLAYRSAMEQRKGYSFP